MIGRDLERSLVALGGGQSSVDTVMRKLRHAKLLPVGGRGPYAPDISARDAAIVLTAWAGSTAAADADQRIVELQDLPCADENASTDTFIDALTELLKSSSATEEVDEVRVGKNVNRAEIWFRDGRIRRFWGSSPNGRGLAMYRAEGVLPGPLLNYLARVLAGETQPPKHSHLALRS